MRVDVIIPALNEAGNIRRLVERIPCDAAESVRAIVVDNGSTDATADEARQAGALVVSEPRRGYGYACAAGASVADAEVLIFLDGDGSFDPAQIPDLLAPIRSDEADLVLGSRMKGGLEPGAMPPHQRYGNQWVSASMRLLYGLPLTDLGPYRAIRCSVFKTLHMREMTFGWPTEMIVKAARHQARIVEVGVTYGRRWSGKSKVSGTLRGTLLATWFILRVTIRYAFA
jgi:glycosyltransferase involved in cell wall biosynthesis